MAVQPIQIEQIHYPKKNERILKYAIHNNSYQIFTQVSCLIIEQCTPLLTNHNISVVEQIKFDPRKQSLHHKTPWSLQCVAQKFNSRYLPGSFLISFSPSFIVQKDSFYSSDHPHHLTASYLVLSK